MKDHLGRPDEPLPVRWLQAAPAPASVVAPEPAADDYADPGGHAAPKRFSARLLWRACRRHWWLALLLWAGGTAGLEYLAYTRIKPTYDAFSIIKVEQGDSSIFAKTGTAPIDFALYLQSQVQQVTSPTVVETALARHPELMSLPMLRGSREPAVDIRENVRVAIVERTDLIRVDLSSQFPGETAEIVNAVVDSYIEHSLESFSSTTQKQISRLKDVREKQTALVKNLRNEIASLTSSMDVAAIDTVRDANVVSIDAYHKYSEALTDVTIKRIGTRAKLDRLRNESAPARGLDPQALKEEVTQLFYLDPRVDSLQRERAKLERDLETVGHNVRNKSSDPTLVSLTRRLDHVNGSIQEHWNRMEPGLKRKVSSMGGDANLERQIADSEADLAAMAVHEEALQKKLNEAKIETKNSKGEGLKLEYLRKDMERENAVLDKIQEQLNQLEFEQKSPVARVERQSKAKPTSRPNSGRRNQAMLVAPMGTGLAVLLLLVFLELRAARVSDPDELATRMNIQVIGVVPPLPQLTAPRPRRGPDEGPPSLGEVKAQRQLDEFVQSLDHLRVALCARKDAWGRDKHCVLITSACGSEGKTTLAAQLAERCVNAGLMTLLIDGDLRNPTLSRMLDSAESPGLINVLRGDAEAEDVVAVIGDAGGFHFLPAGTPKMDPSRLLQGERLGKLIAQARESFDMIIVDAPPVLPVPDALTIGRWTDGAVLAVRYDTSRFPLVERANRRLTHVGVPVLGVVVNGVRTVESSYGGYYSYGGYSGYNSASPVSTAEGD